MDWSYTPGELLGEGLPLEGAVFPIPNDAPGEAPAASAAETHATPANPPATNDAVAGEAPEADDSTLAAEAPEAEGLDQAREVSFADPTALISQANSRDRRDPSNLKEITPDDMDPELGANLCRVCLGAYLLWNTEEPWDWPDLRILEVRIAEVETGDVLTASIWDGEGMPRVEFFDEDNRQLPFEPWLEYDQVEFAKMKAMAREGWMFTCVVQDCIVYGGDCAPREPNLQWRLKLLFADVYARPSDELGEKYENEFSEIMAGIGKRITGDFRADVAMVLEAIEHRGQYPHHADKLKQELEGLLITIGVAAARAASDSRDPQGALEILAPYVKAMEHLREPGEPFDSRECQYMSFGSYTDFLMAEAVSAADGGLKRASEEDSTHPRLVHFDAAAVFEAYASALFDQRQFREALRYTELAMLWNPVWDRLYLGAAEICLELGEMSLAGRYADEAYRLVVSPEGLSNWYEIKAKCIAADGNPKLAAAAMVYGSAFNDNELIRASLRKLCLFFGLVGELPSLQQAGAMLRDGGLPLGASSVATKVLADAIDAAVSNEEFEGALDYAKRLYGLTADEKAKGLMNTLERFCEQRDSKRS